MISSKWAPLVAIGLGTFMLLVDVTIVTVALPTIGTDLGSSVSSLQWIIDAYALALAALLLGTGSFADATGRRRVYIAGLGVFAVASLACGIAPSTDGLIGARALQGVGAAAMFATSTALLSNLYRGRDRGVAFGVWGAVASIAAAAGPLGGGVLTELFSWRAIFLVNLPIGLATILVARAALPEAREDRPRRFDLPGFAAFTLGVLALATALVRASHAGWTAPETLALAALGAVGLVVFVAVERSSRQPLLDLRLLQRPAFSAVLVSAMLLPPAAFATLVYLALWLESALHLTPIETGLVVLPLPVAALLTSALGGRSVRGGSVRWAIGAGMLLIAVGDLIQSRLSDASDVPLLVAGLVITGAGVGVANPALLSTGLAAAPEHMAGMAAGAVNTARQLGLALGIAVLGIAYGTGADGHGEAGNLSTMFVVAGVVGAVCAAVALVVLRPAPASAGLGARRSVRRRCAADGAPPSG